VQARLSDRSRFFSRTKDYGHCALGRSWVVRPVLAGIRVAAQGLPGAGEDELWLTVGSPEDAKPIYLRSPL
jgi:hypothetical protein